MKVKNLRSFVVLAGVAALSLTACASEEPEEEAIPSPTVLAYETVESTSTTVVLIEEPPDVDLSPEDSEFVLFEASWVCELQRRTFSDPAAIQAALDSKLVDTGLSAADYEAFRARVNGDRDLRSSILYEYQQTCRT